MPKAALYPIVVSGWLAMSGLQPALAQTDAPAGAASGSQTSAQAGEDVSRFAPVEVDAIGHGINRDAAIANALSTALAQETGVSVAQISVSATGAADTDNQKTVTSSTTAAPPSAPPSAPASSPPASPVTTGNALPNTVKPTTNTVDTKDHMDGAGQVTVNAMGTSGRVQRYQVISVEPATGGGFDAKVHAVLMLTKRQAGAGSGRRRIAVGDFTGEGTALRDKLVMDLTQTRRFAVMDRAHDDAYQQEMNVLSAQGAPEEQARASQVLGADYVLTGSIHVAGARTTGHAATTSAHTLELTGEVIQDHTASTLHTIAGSMQADFQLIEIATRQIVLADHLSLTGTNMDAVAEKITGDIIETIYPPRLISVADPAAMIINQGGAGMHIGQQFRVMKMGEELTDPYTHESLGRTEHQIGVIEITDVQPKISYARMVSGQAPDNPADAMLRAAAATVQQVATAAPRAPRHVAHRKVAADAAPDESSQSGGLRFGFDH